MKNMGREIPLGVPDLMVGFTADGQTDPTPETARDRGLGISSESKWDGRKDIAAPAILPGADAWKKGKALELELKPVKKQIVLR